MFIFVCYIIKCQVCQRQLPLNNDRAQTTITCPAFQSEFDAPSKKHVEAPEIPSAKDAFTAA